MVKGKKKIYILLAVVMAVAIIAELLFAHPHYHMLWNEVPGFDIIIGFAGAWFLIVLAKIVMSKLLQRKEGYYDEDAAQNADRCAAQDPCSQTHGSCSDETHGPDCAESHGWDCAETHGPDCAESQDPEKGGMSHV